MTPKLSDCAETGGATYGLLLYALAESVRARRVLEIGAGWGHSGAAFAQSLRHRLPSTLISVDPHPERLRKDCADSIASSAVTWDVVGSTSAAVDIAGPFDLIYIDGDPSQARADFDKFAPMLRPGGLLIMDGYGGQPGPTDAVDALADSARFAIIPYHNAYSFAVHSSAPEKIQKGGHFAKCELCGDASVQPSWSKIDAWADSHVAATSHTVGVYVMPRRIKYRKGPRP
jgi:hypothetical protein